MYAISLSLFCLCNSPSWAPRWVGTGGGEQHNFNMDKQQTPPGHSQGDPHKNKHKNQQKNKRPRENSSDFSDSAIDQEVLSSMWPRYLVIHSTDAENSLGKLSPFAVYKAIKGIAGEPEDVNRMRSGDFIIKVTRKSHSDNLLKTTRMVEVPVQVSPHKTLNSVKGIIRSYEIRNTEEEEILQELQSQGVTGVRRIKARRDGTLQNTVAVILTFGLSVLPTHVKCGWMRLPVDMYIPNPLRCFQCQRFGHHRANCRRKEVCARCGEEGHGDRGCEAPARCVNCKGEHNAFFKQCPQWLKEQAIQRVKTQNNLTFPEARKRVEEAAYKPPTTRTFAQVVSEVEIVKATRSIGIQTTMTWPLGESARLVDKDQEVVLNTRSTECQTTVTQTEVKTKKITNTKPKIVSSKTKKKKYSSAAEFGNIGTASVADKGRLALNSRGDSGVRHVVKKKLTQLRRTGDNSPNVSAAEQLTSSKKLSPEIATSNSFDVLHDILDRSSMDFDLDVPDPGLSGACSK